jgi:hypothetical protein
MAEKISTTHTLLANELVVYRRDAALFGNVATKLLAHGSVHQQRSEILQKQKCVPSV